VKGIVFNLLEAVVTKEHGENVWETLLDNAGMDGAYTSLGSYPDDQLMRLVAAASGTLKCSDAEVLQWFGRNAMSILAERYPQFFKGQSSTRAFLLTLNEIIHPEVRKIYPGADVPVFDFDSSSPNVLVVGYRSRRKLCALAEGFVEGAAEHFGQSLTFEHLQCMHHGADKCVFRIVFS
jgi:hypothetical protein